VVEELEHRVLRVRACAAPSDWRRGMSHRFAVARDRFSVRLHLKLLEVEGQQAKPLVVRENAAGLAAEVLDVEPVGESRDQRYAGCRLTKAKVPVHFGRAFEQSLERIPAERQSSA